MITTTTPAAVKYNTLPTTYQQYIHLSRYARWLPEDSRRETWDETVNPYFDFFEGHLKEFTKGKLTKNEREELEQAVLSINLNTRCTASEASWLMAERTKLTWRGRTST